ncbi:isochorismatase family protein [Pelomicrobium methylotrophicum]|uniref:nicotinamidase n=1 Tax=Pelomicrobium methylotrophicum TaxID=2602750 RepID=A0A5C7EYR8_9PROT|nr:isochorismatase family protein [Pelomicrobium methylotrophicum]TXF12232.1 isochorismatase family protein [Pelomicrobium methylotrophicum]
MAITVSPSDALIIVDVQNDFLPGGALAVPEGDRVVEPLNRAAALFEAKGLAVFATRDWHPENHCSFKAQGGPWPPHCVAGTPGAAFAPSLRLPTSTIVISKATTPERDAYSGFQGTELADLLRRRGVKRVVVGGLATDYCVLNTVKDALAHGFQVLLLTDAIRAVDVKPGDGDAARAEMERRGAVPITVADLA